MTRTNRSRLADTSITGVFDRFGIWGSQEFRIRFIFTGLPLNDLHGAKALWNDWLTIRLAVSFFKL